jgi:hypothetical protein
MTYSSGGLIQAADYNTFSTNINNIWGTGSGDSGWGQTNTLPSVSNSGTTGVIASVTIANTVGGLTVTAGSYFIGQQIQISGTLTAGTINGTNNYTTPSIFYIITVASSTSITISLTPSGAAVASSVGTATPGGTFNVLSAQSLVTATPWANLVNTLSTVGSQTNTTLTARTAPVAGGVITPLPNLATDIASVTAQRGYAANSGLQSQVWTGNLSKETPTGGVNDGWQISWFQDIDFPSADQARYFWNAGGLISIQMNKQSTGSALDTVWNTFVATVGTLYISGRVNNADQVIAGTTYTGFTRIGGSGIPETYASTTGWYSLNPGSSGVQVFGLRDSAGPYPNNGIFVSLSSQTGPTSLRITTTWVQSNITPTDDTISGGTPATQSGIFFNWGTAPGVLPRVILPALAPLQNTWGLPTVESQVQQ